MSFELLCYLTLSLRLPQLLLLPVACCINSWNISGVSGVVGNSRRSQTQRQGTCYVVVRYKGPQIESNCARQVPPASFYVAYFAAPSSTSASAFGFIQLERQVDIKRWYRDSRGGLLCLVYAWNDSFSVELGVDGKVLKACHINGSNSVANRKVSFSFHLNNL